MRIWRAIDATTVLVLVFAAGVVVGVVIGFLSYSASGGIGAFIQAITDTLKGT